MRISDWSSDVCSSDLVIVPREREVVAAVGKLVAVHRGVGPEPVELVVWLAAVEGGGVVEIDARTAVGAGHRSEEHTSELQSLMRISYAVFCLKKKKQA